MSVINKIRELTSTIEEIAKEKPVVTLISDNRLLAENYSSLKLFESGQIILNMGKTDLVVSGKEMSIDFFSSARLIVSGTFNSVCYLSGEKEEL